MAIYYPQIYSKMYMSAAFPNFSVNFMRNYGRNHFRRKLEHWFFFLKKEICFEINVPFSYDYDCCVIYAWLKAFLPNKKVYNRHRENFRWFGIEISTLLALWFFLQGFHFSDARKWKKKRTSLLFNLLTSCVPYCCWQWIICNTKESACSDCHLLMIKSVTINFSN